MANPGRASASSAAGSRSLLSTLPSSHPNSDHVILNRQRLSNRDAPPDVPPLVARWYFATDVPKSKPFMDKSWKPPKPPSKFTPFSLTDSRNIELAYQQKQGSAPNTVAVNEDRLFQVDILKREISPIYWNGPVYDVRRGTWFYADSSTLKPCDENLANQIEEGYLKIQPFKRSAAELPTEVPTPKMSEPGTPTPPAGAPSGASDYLTVEGDAEGHKRSSSFTESITSAFTFRSRSRSVSRSGPASSRSTSHEAREKVPPSAPVQSQPDTWPLYGPHMGKYVIYSNDASYAWIISDDFYGKFASTVYQRLTAGASMGGIKIVRGWSDVKQKATAKTSTSPATSDSPAEADTPVENQNEADVTDETVKLVQAIQASTAAEAERGSMKTQEAQDNAMLEAQMEQDYNAGDYEDPNREIDHVVLCIHGIGQKLGQRVESVNFVGDVNQFRKTIKSVYSTSLDLQALNNQAGVDSKLANSRIQVLPVCWRHNIHFGLQHKEDDDDAAGSAKFRKEQDIGDLDEDGLKSEKSEFATLQDITVDGVPALRGIISEVLLDILLYYQPNYRERIMRSVTNECNRIYQLFRKWNPNFNGQISIAGHSLGSAIAFDILCRQPDSPAPGRGPPPPDPSQLALEFDVDSFFGLGSPVGLFQMLKGKTIGPRTSRDQNASPLSPLDYDIDNPFKVVSEPVSRPKVEDVYNVFHPADPISYRLEPLVVKRMAELKPQSIPSTRRGLNTQIANLTELTQRVAQSASNMWSSMASGLASTILNKSLGYDGETTYSVATGPANPTPEAGTFRNDLAITIHNPPEEGVETLYSRFQKESGKLTKAADEHARLQHDEELIRALNYTGRLDFSLPDGYMDITLLASMGSHLGYFRDPDVANFVIGQLLARPYPKRLKHARMKTGKLEPFADDL